MGVLSSAFLSASWECHVLLWNYVINLVVSYAWMYRDFNALSTTTSQTPSTLLLSAKDAFCAKRRRKSGINMRWKYKRIERNEKTTCPAFSLKSPQIIIIDPELLWIPASFTRVTFSLVSNLRFFCVSCKAPWCINRGPNSGLGRWKSESNEKRKKRKKESNAQELEPNYLGTLFPRGSFFFFFK